MRIPRSTLTWLWISLSLFSSMSIRVHDNVVLTMCSKQVYNVCLWMNRPFSSNLVDIQHFDFLAARSGQESWPTGQAVQRSYIHPWSQQVSNIWRCSKDAVGQRLCQRDSQVESADLWYLCKNHFGVSTCTNHSVTYTLQYAIDEYCLLHPPYLLYWTVCRLYPSIPMVPRKIVEDVEIFGYHIPAEVGQSILLKFSLYMSHH